jgi:hypothetical protein
MNWTTQVMPPTKTTNSTTGSTYVEKARFMSGDPVTVGFPLAGSPHAALERRMRRTGEREITTSCAA